MELSVAKNLLRHGVDNTTNPQTWADLGAGDGLFTKALADLLPSGSKLIAVDKNENALKRISLPNSTIGLQLLVADFNSFPNDMPPLTGIVMANSLHYIKDQVEFLSRLKSILDESGVLILVEYDLEKSNVWVPFPISKQHLATLADQAGFKLEVFPETVRSRLNSSEIYSALLKL